MQTPIWIKPALFGAAAGAAVLAVLGFGWGGWVTGGTAAGMADVRANQAVLAALAPVCVEKARQDPDVAGTLAAVKAARSYERNQMIMDAGWATMPGADAPNRNVANACWNSLATEL